MLADTLRELAGLRLMDEDGREEILELLPPATAEEIAELEEALPSPLPPDIRAALQVAKGLANGPLESLTLIDLGEFGMEDVFPYAHCIAHDGFGNYWVVDLVPGDSAWSPVFFACHDPPVIAYQCDTVETFVRQAVALWQAGPRSEVDIVHEDVTSEIWAANPGLMSRAEALESGDPVLEGFAASLEPEAMLADLRTADRGDGFPWGRFGSRTAWRRHGNERLWATVPPEKLSFLSRLFGRR